MTPRPVLVVGTRWFDRALEVTYVLRSIAGAASRLGPVVVTAPGAAGSVLPDGGFDVHGLGVPGGYRLPASVPPQCHAIVDVVTPEIMAALKGAGSVDYLETDVSDLPPTYRRVSLVPGESKTFVRVCAPVNPLAERHRHHGFGFTGYTLVLSDRRTTRPEPPEEAAWLTAAFPDTHVVIVEEATAWAWRARALRGHAAVHTRTDLWRLMAHAQVCLDLAPGPCLARECLEAMQFGTPIIVPRSSGPATTHALAGGGLFDGPDELVAIVGEFEDGTTSAARSVAARDYARANYGDPAALVESVRSLVSPASR
jgi:hypothetical protein